MAETPVAVGWTVADLDRFPDDEWHRYEIIDGELFVSKAPRDDHQVACSEINTSLGIWNRDTALGYVMVGPGVIFSETDAVIPDVVWVSRERRAAIRRDDGHLYGAPELVVEVLSPGATNERRDRDTKLRLYSAYGVLEYWIVDTRLQTVAVYRHQDGRLQLVTTLTRDDTLTSPVLPRFTLPIAHLFPLT